MGNWMGSFEVVAKAFINILINSVQKRSRKLQISLEFGCVADLADYIVPRNGFWPLRIFCTKSGTTCDMASGLRRFF